MPKTVTVLRVFVASPGDVKEERNLLEKVVQEINLLWRDQLGITLELVKWETHVIPAISVDAQAAINEQIRDDYDIFVGILWTRFGTPTGRATSGTEEEFNRAYAKWKANPNDVRVMMYFKGAPISPDQIDPEQLARVHTFRKSLREKGVFDYMYTSLDEFRELLRVHLSHQIQNWIKPATSDPSDQQGSTAKSTVTELTPPTAGAEDEEGFIDLIERTLNESARASEVVQHLGQALSNLIKTLEEATNEINTATGDDRARLATYKRGTNRVADVMADFSARMKTELPILRDALYGALDAYGRTISLIPDFQSSGGNVELLNRALQTTTALKAAMLPSQQGIRRLRETISGLPKVTLQFNRAKREILEVLDAYLETVDRALNVTPEIEMSIRSILASSESQSGPQEELGSPSKS
ncbi:MAG: DUF4062 domain-containing protein [Blastocatellia bacterium]|nr:DUF4062 domain-containing protein [Blastocatellia bacterium]